MWCRSNYCLVIGWQLIKSLSGFLKMWTSESLEIFIGEMVIVFLVIDYICSVDLYLNDYVIDSDKCMRVNTQLKFTCSKLTTETLEKGVKYAQS